MSPNAWLLFMFLILTNLSAIVTAQNYWCFNNGNYTSNSTYSTNLNTLLSSLSSNMDNYGFHNASEGPEGPDRANAVALCLGDTQPKTCRDCVQNATVQLLNLCPDRKQAILWRDVCTLRYSNESIVGNRADFPTVMIHNILNVSSPRQFKEDLRTLLDDLGGRMASGGSRIKVGAGNRTAPDFQTIFALLQCTPDISPEDCTGCLSASAQRLPGCCNNSPGAVILAPSCYLRYETAPFYNITRIQETEAALVPVQQPVPTPPIPSSPIPSPPIFSPPGNGGDNTVKTVIVIVLPIALGLILILVIFVGICMRKRIKKKPVETIDKSNGEISTTESIQYDFGKVRAATNDFSDANKLGQGGFGAVYKGKLQNGQEIAVKRLSRGSGQGDLEFKNEVLLVAKLQHKNLVRLLGFAIEGTERLLVYEFVQNASLDHFIFDPTKRSYIDWNTRYKIIGGIARGVLYLHEDSRFRIIHRDLKASNILLDGEMNPKIADFGMARLFVQDESEGSTSRIVGTYGYMAPEYAIHGQVSVKLDVFSFGVLVLEIVCGQKCCSFQNGEAAENMLSFAWRNWHDGTTTNMIDPVLRNTRDSLRDMLRSIHIGLLCVQENAIDRPTMASVVGMLNSFSITLPVPSRPAFFVPNGLYLNSREQEFNQSSANRKSAHSSKNDASITELYPR